jgi:hypothetical protein
MSVASDKARALAAAMAAKKPSPAPKAPAGSFSYKQYLDSKKKGTFKGMDNLTSGPKG